MHQTSELVLWIDKHNWMHHLVSRTERWGDSQEQTKSQLLKTSIFNHFQVSFFGAKSYFEALRHSFTWGTKAILCHDHKLVIHLLGIQTSWPSLKTISHHVRRKKNILSQYSKYSRRILEFLVSFHIFHVPCLSHPYIISGQIIMIH